MKMLGKSPSCMEQELLRSLLPVDADPVDGRLPAAEFLYNY